MVYNSKGAGSRLGTASKTITLDISAWANLAEICNRKEWNMQKALTRIIAEEAEFQRFAEKQKALSISEFKGNPNTGVA